MTANNPGLAPLAVTMGDPAGIGPEIILKAWSARQQANLPPFFAIAAEEAFTAIDSSAPVAKIAAPAEAAETFASALPVLPLELPLPVTPGTPQPGNAPAVINAIEKAVALSAAGEACGLVTAPVAKAILYAAGFEYPGQTEFVAALTATAIDDAVMMLAGPDLRVVPLTIHVPLADVPKRLTRALLLRRARVTVAALKADFGIEDPRLAVCGLNPHAGEDGRIGREEVDIIAPAVGKLMAEGLAVTGPYPADALFHADARSGYDAVLAMYHDQALIPLKTINFYDGVNVTLGLPVVRTSPDHGTAFSIAGTGRADARSMIAAIRLAGSIAQRRGARHG